VSSEARDRVGHSTVKSRPARPLAGLNRKFMAHRHLTPDRPNLLLVQSQNEDRGWCRALKFFRLIYGRICPNQPTFDPRPSAKSAVLSSLSSRLIVTGADWGPYPVLRRRKSTATYPQSPASNRRRSRRLLSLCPWRRFLYANLTIGVFSGIRAARPQTRSPQCRRDRPDPGSPHFCHLALVLLDPPTLSLLSNESGTIRFSPQCGQTFAP
jgi:hypothetical protein